MNVVQNFCAALFIKDKKEANNLAIFLDTKLF